MKKRIVQLREQLACNLHRLIGNEAVEKKELAAFDLIMSRRQFLKAAEVEALAALVGSSMVPTAWGKTDPKLKVDPGKVGLTVEDQAAVSKATQLVYGTELNQDPIYARPVISPQEQSTHGIVEGARGRLQLQSQLDAGNPTEAQFLDRGFHYGPSELIQLEKDGANWQLVHYYHPWSARTDGARTDGLERHVILTGNTNSRNEADWLADPIKVHCLTGVRTNQFRQSGNQVLGGGTYFVFVEQKGFSNLVFIGQSSFELTPPYVQPMDYPVVWSHNLANNLFLPAGETDYFLIDKYSNSGFLGDGSYDPSQAYEHLVIYGAGAGGGYYTLWVVSLDDSVPGKLNVINTSIENYPSKARVVHIGGTPTADTPLTEVVLTESVSTQDGSTTKQVYTTYRVTSEGARHGPQQTVGPDQTAMGWSLSAPPDIEKTEANAALTDENSYDFTTLQNVHHLFSYTTKDPNESLPLTNHVKLGFLQDRGIVLFGISVWSASAGVQAVLNGYYALALPDAGVGQIVTLSGGVSKFGGFRYFALDANGNLFMLRQRRKPLADTPYGPPIYAQYNADGNPEAFPTTSAIPIPSTTDPNAAIRAFAAGSPLCGQFVTLTDNVLLNTALAFGTDDTNLSQAVWLGSGFQAVYAPNRFSHDAQHVVVKKVQNNENEVYGCFNVFNNPVDKSWRSRQIATQTVPAGPGMQQSGDHYQADIAPANAYGKITSLSYEVNKGIQIEVRADSPTTVIDEVSNLYYDIDRYTSFIGNPDPGTGRLSVAVKADVLAQVIYARLIDTSGLAPSSDAAMLSSSEPGYDWVSINLATQAQQRMSTDGSTQLGAVNPDGTTPDTTVYVSGSTIGGTRNDPQYGWQTKGNYDPSNDNLNSLATYLNQSSANMLAAAPQLTGGGLRSGQQVDPLTAVTPLAADPARSTVTTVFGYAAGTVACTLSGPQGSPGQLGGIFSSISHALHDAFNWLQHVEDEAYDDLKKGVTVTIDTAEGIAVTVSADIMKNVNGVEQDLNEVVSTVEEYASVVENVIITVIESSFMYQFIMAIIALISFFIHFKEILELKDSYYSFFQQLFDPNSPQAQSMKVPSNIVVANEGRVVVGPENTVTQNFEKLSTSNVPAEIVDDVVDSILRNPIVNKILGVVLSAVCRAIAVVDSLIPISFNMAPAPTSDLENEMTALLGSLESATANVTEDTINAFLNQFIQDIMNPQATYTNFAEGLGPLMTELESDAMSPFYELMQNLGNQDFTYLQQMLQQGDFLTLKIPLLADLFMLFGLGTASGSEVKLSAHDAVFFPIAVITWITIYRYEGRTISSVDDLHFASTSRLPAPQAGAMDDVALAATCLKFVVYVLNSFYWLYKAGKDASGGGSSQSQQQWYSGIKDLLVGFNSWVNWFGAIAPVSLMIVKGGVTPPQTDWDIMQASVNLTTFSVNMAVDAESSSAQLSVGATPWPSSVKDVTQFLRFIARVMARVADTVIELEDVSEMTTADVLKLVGTDIAAGGRCAQFFYRIFQQAAQDSIEYWAIAILGAPWALCLNILAQTEDMEAVSGRKRKMLLAPE